MMEKNCGSGSVAKCNNKKQHSLEANIKSICSKSVTEKEKRGGDHPQTEVMVERVSSTTEHSPLTIHKKQLDVAKSVLPNKIPNAKAMAEKHRNKEKYAHSRTPDQNVFKSKLNKSSHLGREDERLTKQLQERKDKALNSHTSTKKHITKEDKQVESEVSSSSLASASFRTSVPATTQIRNSSSPLVDRKLNSRDSERVTKSLSERDKYVRPPSGKVNTIINHRSSLAENRSQDMGKRECFRQNKETSAKLKSHKANDRSFRRDKNEEPNSYEKMVEMKVREIRNNLEKMTSEIPSTLARSVSKDAVSESRQQDEKGPDKGCKDQCSQLVPFLPSSRCCSPPPRPTNVTKYWSDAEETEDDSDVEVHLMHVNSVNIVLNFLKKNTNKYYIDGKEVRTQNTNIKTKQIKRNSKTNVKNRLSYQPHTASNYARSQSVHPREHPHPGKRRGMSMTPTEQYHAGSTVREHCSPAREHYGHSSRPRSPLLATPSSWRDQRSRSPSRHREFYDRKRSLHSPSGYRRYHYSRSRSPPGYQESFERNRDHRYRESSPQRSKRSFSRDRRSDSPPPCGAGPYRESFSPPRYREDFHRYGESPVHTWDAEDFLRNRGSLSPSPVFDEESIYRNREFSPQSFRRSPRQRSPEGYADFGPRKQVPYGTDTNCHSEDLRYADSRLQHVSHGLSDKDHALSRGSEMQLKGKDSFPMSTSGYGFNPLSQDHSPSQSDHQISSHARHTHGFESPRSGISESAKPYASVVRQESGLGRPRSKNSEENVTSRRQLSIRHESEKLPIQFGRGAKKALNSYVALSLEKKFPSDYSRKQQQKTRNFSGNSDHFFSGIGEDNVENQRGNLTKSGKVQGERGKRDLEEDSFLHISLRKDINISTPVAQENVSASQMDVITLEDDDEPTIDRPEDYLNASSSVSTYHRPSFVPDTLDRRKFVSLAETSELSQTQEDMRVPGPSGITSIHSFGGKERDDSQYWLSDSKSDLKIDNVDSTVPQVSSPGTSQETALSSGTPNVAQLSSTLKGITTEVPGKTEEKAFLTLNSAEMSTLLTLINLAKEHVATGKDLPTNLSQILETGHDKNNSKISEPQGDQSRKNPKQQPSLPQMSAGMQDKGKNEKKIKATTSKSNIKDNGNSGDGQNSKKDVASVTNKNSTIPEGKKNEIVLKRKTGDDFSKTKGNKKPSQSKSKTLGNKTDDKLPKGKKSHEQSLQKCVEETSQEKCKENGQSSEDGRDVKETIKKKEVNHKDEAKRQSKSNTKGTAVERTFAEMQSVRVELSASREVVASSKQGKHYKVEGTTTLRTSKKKQLKQIGKRIFIRDSSDSDSDDSESSQDKKDASPEVDNHPQAVHPLHQETIVLDHSVNICLACKHILKPDEFTSMFLNTGTVTMRCRNCHTYTRMEEVMPLDSYTAISMPKNVASKATCSAPSKTSATSGTLIDNDNSKVSKKGNMMTSSKQRQNKTTIKKGESLDSNKQALKEKKHFSQESKSVVKGRKVDTSVCKKGTEKKCRLAGAENASKTGSVSKSSKDDKCQRDRKESESSSSLNKATDFEMREEEQKLVNEFDSIDSSLRIFPWKSSRKRKKLHEDLTLDEDSSDYDECNKYQEHEEPHKKRIKKAPSTKRKHDETSTHPSKPKQVLQPSTTTKVSIPSNSSDAVKTSNSTKSAGNTNPGMNTKPTTAPKPTTTSKLTTAVKPVTTSKSTTYPKPTTASNSTTAFKSCTTSTPTATKSTTVFKPKTELKSNTIPLTTPKSNSAPKSNMETKSSSVVRSTGTESTSIPKPSTSITSVISIKSHSDGMESKDTRPDQQQALNPAQLSPQL